MSRALSGLGVSPGIAIGEPVVHETRPISTLRITIPPEKVDAEIERFRHAVAATVDHIQENRDRASQQMGEEYAAIFEAHQLIASDPSFTGPVEKVIREQEVNAGWAIDQVLEKLIAKFEALPDEYLADRKLDVLDVATQILHALQGLHLGQLEQLDRPVILVADDLPPSAAVQLPLDKMLGFALEMGGPTSHTTIIARSLGIPVIVGARGSCEEAKRSRRIALDAFEGKIVFDPNPAELSEYKSRQREYHEQQATLLQMRHVPTVTRDGRSIQLLANIDLSNELGHAMDWNVAGVGLYRSEFLYMKMSPALPTEKDHIEVYREMVSKMAPHPVTIRTFDLGGRKLAREIIGEGSEANPVLGLRGIRLCFSKPDFFRAQLRALLLTAGEFPVGRLKIMFPLISGIEEVRVARLLVREISAELRAVGHEIPDGIPLGAMVEVPSSAIMARELAREVDFISIGTNDLIQYTLAVDRSNNLVADLYRPTNPAVLRLIAEVIAAGEAENTDVSMCGEMAADPLMVPVLVGLGLRSFSMNPQAVPVVRALIRQLSFREAGQIARQAAKFVTARDVEEYLLERLAFLLAKTKIQV
ncbi:MAG: phosphoenolpyruvate--protein phosphotransferase [Acidobacteria bacterium]|uniref:Phosphoenolpyruvate-protein phosphotransferase n=1 Tax=Candidatus Sulfomarinibacter kjeldsenii TaxID=2885994 RepID=A0A8J7CF45_9BACT|nr:phosphoenolpyruvate--protein phosphotransferase [Candidatus Sulfomarinibacter kjeldsenii]